MSTLSNTNCGWSWLKSHWSGENFYAFAIPDGSLEVIGVEELKTFETLAEALPYLTPSTFAFFEMPFYGKQLKVIIPKKLFVRKNECLYTIEQSENSQKQVFVKPGDFQSLTAQDITLVRQHDTPDREDWTLYFQKAQRAFRNTDIKKLVLARKSIFTLTQTQHPIDFALTFLTHSKNTYGVFRYSNGELFFCKTPEKLFSYADKTLCTVAIAGTQSNQQDPQELQQSLKNQLEHDFVVSSIKKTLSSFSNDIIVEKQNILELSNLIHLRTPIQAQNIEPESLDAIMKSLHPTPAISGSPQTRSLDWLSDHEPMDRAQYAGVMGILNPELCEAVVTIRSGEMTKNQVRVYTGVGVVAESDEQLEWEELELKLKQILAGFIVSSEQGAQTQI